MEMHASTTIFVKMIFIQGQVLRFGEHNIAHLRKELHKAVDEQKESFSSFVS